MAEKIIAYGASARSSTLLNYCGLSHKNISFIIDKNPLKNNKFSPGSNIPIVSFEKGIRKLIHKKVVLLLAWNFKKEILNDLRNNGFTGKVIVPLPKQIKIL